MKRGRLISYIVIKTLTVKFIFFIFTGSVEYLFCSNKLSVDLLRRA